MDDATIPHERKTDMLYRAVFGERDPRTLKRKWGLQDTVTINFWLSVFLTAHALGIPTDKFLEYTLRFFTASAALLAGK